MLTTPEPKSSKQVLPVKSARRVLDVLEPLASEPRPMALHEISAVVAMPASSAHRIMSTLVDAGFVDQNDKRYTLSMKWFALMSAALASVGSWGSGNLRQVAYPVMLQLAAEFKVTANLAVLQGRS